MEPRKQAICDALRTWINQRPGFDPNNYDRAGHATDIVAAMTHYDHARVDHSEHSSRRMAALYLCRKLPGTDELVALEWLADALARRAASKLQTAETAIIQR